MAVAKTITTAGSTSRYLRWRSRRPPRRREDAGRRPEWPPPASGSADRAPEVKAKPMPRGLLVLPADAPFAYPQ